MQKGVARTGRPPLPKIESADDLDRLDIEIVAALGTNPEVTCREISEKTGSGITTVWDRIQRIRKSDWVESMRRELKSLGPKMVQAVDDGLTVGVANDRASVSLRLQSGLGVLEDKRRIEVDIAKATDEQIIERLVNMSDEKFNELLSKRADKATE